MKETENKQSERIKVVGYVRVSSASQAEEGISIPAQKEKIHQWANLHDAEILEIFEDNGISGVKSNRPGLKSAMELACKEKAVFVVYSLSRFSRSTTDTLKLTNQLQKAGAELVSVSEQIDTLSAAGKMVFRILAVLNEFEIEQGGERTKSALQYRRNQGKKLGGLVPFGYEADEEGLLTENESEQQIIQQIQKKHESGWKYVRIARWLNTNDIKTKTGKSWQIQTVKNIILSKPKTLKNQKPQKSGSNGLKSTVTYKRTTKAGKRLEGNGSTGNHRQNTKNTSNEIKKL